jgi:hypothetical protein
MSDSYHERRIGTIRKPEEAVTDRERMMATIRGEPTDRIPWAPRMDLWYIALRARNAVPERFAGMTTAGMADELGAACHAVGADFTLSGGRDVSLRGFGIDNHQDYPYRVELRDLPADFKQGEGHLKTRIKTPSGEVYTHLKLTTEMASEGISLPFVESYAIESVDDFERVAQVFEHLEVIPTPDSYRGITGSHDAARARGDGPFLLPLRRCAGPDPRAGRTDDALLRFSA